MKEREQRLQRQDQEREQKNQDKYKAIVQAEQMTRLVLERSANEFGQNQMQNNLYIATIIKNLAGVLERRHTWGSGFQEYLEMRKRETRNKLQW